MERYNARPAKEKDPLLVEADADANIFNLRCLCVLALLALLSYILEMLGLFTASREVMLPSAIACGVLFLLPVAVHLICSKCLKNKVKVVEKGWFKYLVIASVYLGIALLCVMLTIHAVLLMAIPPLMAAQYHDHRRLFFITLVLTVLLVPIGVYGGYFFGAIDRNYFKGMLTDEETQIFANRLALATPKRMLEIFLHYALPRLFGVVAIVVMAYGTVRRNGKMLARQQELMGKVKDEMEHVNKMQSQVIDALATLIENRDVGTGDHVIRTKYYVKMIAEALAKNEKFRDQLDDETLELIESAAPLHDVGKIAISDNILLKPAKLTKEEFDSMKAHTIKGRIMVGNILKNIENDRLLKIAEDIAVSHHEKWDGSGYPYGLREDDIPLPARIMAVADVFDALVSVRVYKDAVKPEEAIDVMMQESGKHFDPDIMQAFWEIKDDLIAYVREPAKVDM